MLDRLPDLLDPLEFVEKKRRVHGAVPLADLERLRDVLADASGSARVELSFGRQGHIAAIVGTVTADLPLQCQCCLEPLILPVRSAVRLGIVSSIDEANLLPDDYEPLLVPPGGCVASADIVEEELLLAVPTIPRHPVCQMPAPAAALEPKDNPFAGLADLKKPTQE